MFNGVKMPVSIRFAACIPWAALWGVSVSALCAAPVVSDLDVRALQTGTVTTLTFKGTGLLPNPRLLSTAPIRSQKVREGASAAKVSIDVEVDENAVPGLENWWLVTDDGVSARALLAVDALPQKPLAAQAGVLPVALHGSVSGSQVSEVSFTGKKGQLIRCEVEAQRLQSKLRPVLKLYDARNILVAWSAPQHLLRGDCRLEVSLPAEGSYKLSLHDLQYNATAPSHFRLKIGDWDYADSVFPSTVQAGSSAEVHLVGAGKPSTPVRLPSDAEGDAVPVPWINPGKASGPRPLVWLSAVPQVEEQTATPGPQQLPALPVQVNGRISKPGEVDVYALTVEPESEIELEVVADAIGSPIDADLELRDAKGARLMLVDDGTGTPDPKLVYKVPKGVTALQVAVRNVGGSSGAHCVYRLEASVKPGKAPESFNLRLVEDSHTVRAGRSGVFKVELNREGYAGPVDLQTGPLPKGVSVSGTHIAQSATGALLTLKGETAFEPVITAWKGKGGALVKPVRMGTIGASRFQPWLEDDVALIGVPESGVPFAVEWADATTKTPLMLAGKISVPLRVQRPGTHDGSVRFTLMTSQARVLKQGQLDAPRNLREEKAVTLAEDKKLQQLTDALNAARKTLDAAKTAVAGATAKGTVPENLTAAEQKAQAAWDAAHKALEEAGQKLKNDAEAVVLVPADLPEVPHQLAFKAELLQRDGKTVEAVAYTPVRELPVVNPIQLKLAAPPTAKLDAKAGATVEVAGKIERDESVKGDVTVSIAGLPGGVSQPAAVKVKEGQQDFKFSLKFPANAQTGTVAGIRVSATVVMTGNVQVKSRDADVAVTLEKAAPDSAPKTSG